MKKKFIKASNEYSTLEKHVPAPYLRRKFDLDFVPDQAEISICGLGFYRLFVNGKDITKGHIAPYISNPDDICYYDTYQVRDLLSVGENVIGIILGNGFMNCFGGAVWDLDRGEFRGAPRVALEFLASGEGREIAFEADDSFRTHPSPILMDDLRLGEIYDARAEIRGWAEIGFDDSNWENAILAETPRGELKYCGAEPITVLRKISPVSVTKQDDAYLYDFGVNSAGVCQMKICARRGQKITMWHGEVLKDGKFYNDNIRFPVDSRPYYKEYNQTLRYISSGEGMECYTPFFSYQGFRYVLVEGITEEQATPELLTYHVMSSDLRTIGGFSCSDVRVNKLYEMCVNADRSNFFYFPTDCPHREKNGWTGDASISADHMVLLYDVENSWRVWMDNIRKAQNERGEIPGIIPTAGWGFGKWNGPSWDSALFNLPYMLYKIRGNTDVIRENAHAMVRYLNYILTRREANGTVAIGLGDYLPVGKLHSADYDAPVVLTSSIMVMDMARKASEMFSAIRFAHEAAYADGIYRDMRETVRRELVDLNTMTVVGNCQSSQSIALYFGVFDAEEEQTAFDQLLRFIHAKNNSYDCGFIGLFTLFHVLSKFGQSNLAYQMIVGKKFPSYGFFIEAGETAIPERIMPDPLMFGSHNHHFRGDITRWFMQQIAGLQVMDDHTVRIAPADIDGIDFAEASYELPSGKVSVKWSMGVEGKHLEYSCPDNVDVCVELPENWK